MSDLPPEDAPTSRGRVLVVTVVHNPEDARIRHRQIEALLDAGYHVTYAAPFEGYGVDPRGGPGLDLEHLPRATGRRRLRALHGARQLLRTRGAQYDAILVHDPELLAAAAGLGLSHLVWDVHEDTAAAVEAKPWLPGPVRRPAAALVRSVERWAERHHSLLLAEPAYQERFHRTHPVVANTTTVPASVPPSGGNHVVYLGSVTVARGAAVLADLGRLLAQQPPGSDDSDHSDESISVHVIGPPRDAETTRILDRASAAGHLVCHGFVPNEDALRLVEGALAGLSLLQDRPNYRHSTPTKIYEYLARGVPVITTPLPLAEEVVTASGAGVIVPFDDPEATAQAVLELAARPDRGRALGAAGHAYAREHYDWAVAKQSFVAAVDAVARRPRR